MGLIKTKTLILGVSLLTIASSGAKVLSDFKWN